MTLRRRRGLTAEAAIATINQACGRLRLPTIRAVVDEAATKAQEEQLSYRGFLAELLLAECDDRDRRSSARRVKAAGFPRDKWLGDWARRRQPLCLIGDSGTGKSHLLIGLGTAASIAIASNESFSGWTKTFTDPCLCAAIVDQLTFNGTIIDTGTDSYRLARARAQHTT